MGALQARAYAVPSGTRQQQTSMERLSSGLRINSAADDAAGLAVANKMKSQLRGIKMAMRNSMDGAFSSFKSYSFLNNLLFSFDQ